ncbi:hypothetical protein [Porphyromonas crevioricanis]|uniref:Uncharacterized protein n=1 Tax=Porphyromonas crevioricanis JCM 15906 TaxID=1305617 RepID=T1CQU7_9PORP|nr:hypothetical protein [Porphyromonas crevioricanis]GAD06202.1 hypothetical protein PORCRE_1925 [Porphyromonas crevioricanis JCM 15906]SJZ95814.1 hypothetical protein SAMN02745203_01400 [Porphyromonas crevioricanis]
MQNLNSEILEEKFETFLSCVDDYVENLQLRAKRKGIYLDVSLDSLCELEKYIVQNDVSVDSDEYNDCAAYLGEVVRKEFQGKWICNLDKEDNSLYYGFPVIQGHAPNNVLFSPFHVVKAFVLRKKENLFITAIKSQIYPATIDWSKFSVEDQESHS